MSSLNVSSLNQGLSQVIKRISGNGTVNALAKNIASPGAVHALGNIVSGAIHHHGHGGHMLQQIQQSVASALKTAQANGDTSDPNKTVENAIASILQANLSSSSSNSSDDPASSESPADAADVANGPIAKDNFLDTLQSYGITPQQFHNDFLAAVQDVAAAKGTDPGTVLKNAPQGLILNMVG